MINDKKIIAIILARGESKEVPNKNMRKFNGKTLIAKLIDGIVVSSDDDAILLEANNAGAGVCKRPAELSTDTTSPYDSIIHTLNTLAQDFEYFILLQVTSPLTEATDIDQCIEYCINKNAPACVTFSESQVNPNWMYQFVDGDNNLKKVTPEGLLRRQDCHKTFVINGAIYFVKTDWYREQKSFIVEGTTLGFEMPALKHVDIKTEFDFHRLEMHARLLDELRQNKVKDSSLIKQFGLMGSQQGVISQASNELKHESYKASSSPK
jgi:CMP-N,N'-diacetyllegionaminic acid synthase